MSTVDRFARLYIRLVEMTLTEDRDTDTLILGGLTSIALARGHPLTVATGFRQRDPSQVQNRILHDLIAMIQTWYTDTMSDGRLRLPPVDPDRMMPFDHEEYDRILGSRTRRGGYLLTQMRYLLSHDEVAVAVKLEITLMLGIINMLSVFVGINTQYHALGSHIKYEAEYARGFALLSDISHVGKDLANCFIRFPLTGPVAELAPLFQMRHVMRRICADTELKNEVLDKSKYSVPVTHTLRGVLVPNSVVTTFDLQVWGIRAFSLHHYLHYFLGELVKSLFRIPTEDSGPPVVIRELIKENVYDHDKLDLDLWMLSVIDQTLTSESTDPEAYTTC